jgi:parallel beta-helix repeat protein
LILDGVQIDVNTPLTIPGQVTLIGLNGATIRGVNPATSLVGPLTPPASHTSITGLTFTGTAATATDRQYGIAHPASGAPAATHVTIDGCTFQGMNTGVSVAQGSHWMVRRSTFTGLVGVNAGSGYGIVYANSAHMVAEGNTFTGAPGSGRHAVYLSAGASYCRVTANLITGFRSNAIQILGLATQDRGWHNRVEGNTITGTVNELDTTEGGNGIGVYGQFTGTVIDSNRVDGIDTTATSWGVFVAGWGSTIEDTIVTGNVITGSPYGGIRAASSTSTSVTGNTVSGSTLGPDIALTGAGTWGQQAEIGATVTFNVCRAPARAGVRVYASTVRPAGYVIAGNILGAGSDGAIRDDAGGSSQWTLLNTLI